VLEWQTAAAAAVCAFSALILKGVILETAAIVKGFFSFAAEEAGVKG
jgi:hypothetical protein